MIAQPATTTQAPKTPYTDTRASAFGGAKRGRKTLTAEECARLIVDSIRSRLSAKHDVDIDTYTADSNIKRLVHGMLSQCERGAVGFGEPIIEKILRERVDRITEQRWGVIYCACKA